jgi:hypothetical protein
MRNRVCLGLTIFLLLIAGCTPTDPRTKGKTDISLEITQFRFHPQRWIVPSGENIHMRISNPEGMPHTLVILNKQGLGDLDASDPSNQYWAYSFSMKTVELNFKAPAMPGEFSLVCAEADHKQKGEQGVLIVVIPYP